MISISATFTNGIRFDFVKQKVVNAQKKAMQAALNHVSALSKDQCPLDKGPLVASCSTGVSDDGKKGVISYDTPYAVKQHECTWFNHQRGRKAKYLEDPVNNPGDLKGIMAAAAKGEF